MAWPMDHTITGIEENITKDISCFANAGSVECIKMAPARLEIHWKNQTAQHSAVFSIQTQGIIVDYKKSKYAYREFLSEISSLQYAAEQFLCTIDLPAPIISANCVYDKNNEPITPLFESINEKIDLIQEKNDLLIDRTKVFFIRGAAGTGKTIAMKELAKKQAERFRLGKVSFLFLYIDAQSRALTRLDEAIAHDLDEFSLAFKYTAVKALVRNSLIVPIIDGFDELIGSGGFADAFKSLSAFLASLERQGAIVATGRSVFYEENIFKISADKFSNNDSLNYSINMVSLAPWTDTEIEKFINEKAAPLTQSHRDKIIKKIGKLSSQGSAGEIYRKPFYLTKVIDLFTTNTVKDDESLNELSESTILKRLIDYYIEREVSKFKNKADEPVLSKEGHWYFLRQLALELWWQEQRMIDNATIEAASELTLMEFNIPVEDWPIVLGKSRTYAFLKTASSTGEIDSLKEFESPLYYDYLLSETIKSFLIENNEIYLKQFLSRSLFSESTLTYFSDLVKQISDEDATSAIQKLLSVIPHSTRGSLEIQNIGSLIGVLLSHHQVKNIYFCNVNFYNSDIIEANICNSQFTDCIFRGVRIIDAKIESCTFNNTCFFNLAILSSTQFNNTLFHNDCVFNSISIDNAIYTTFSDAQNSLQQMGAKFENMQQEHRILTDTQKKRIELLKAFLTKASKKYFFDLEPTIEPDFTAVFTNPLWEELSKLLIESSIIKPKRVDKKHKKGSSDVLYHLNEDPDLILTAVFDNNQTTDSALLEDFSRRFFDL